MKRILLPIAALTLFAGCSTAAGGDVPLTEELTLAANDAVEAVGMAPEGEDRAQDLQVPGLDPEVLDKALAAHACAKAKGQVEGDLLTVIDYSKPSTDERLWVIDLSTGETLFHELVSHGRGSGENLATSFSNVPDSKATSIGVFKTAETYTGKHGRSLRMDGLDPGFNDNARDRAIVIHGADYASKAFVEARGRLGLSWGCPALDNAVAQDVIDRIQGGSMVFSYYPDAEWLESSAFFQCS